MKAASKGVKLLVTPENSNRERDYFVDGKPSKEKCYELCEDLDGAFVKGCQLVAKELSMYLAVGVDLKGPESPTVYISSVLIGPDGAIIGVHHKHALWDYEYTLFEPGSEPFEVYDTPIGKIGLLLCADGILPETPRALALLGAQILCNSLNSRGPDEKRMHIPLRAMENHVWHVASNTVGNPNDTGLLWPWTGGSQIVAPDGKVLACASEEDDDLVWADIDPSTADCKRTNLVDDLWTFRRPELYGLLTAPLDAVPAAAMYGPAPAEVAGKSSIRVAMMQLSFYHTKTFTEWACKRQIEYAAKRKAELGCLPSLFCFAPGEVGEDVAAAAEYSLHMAALLAEGAKSSRIHLCATLVEQNGTAYHHTAYLWGPDGTLVGKYRKAHLNREESLWASPGEVLCPVWDTPLGEISCMIEVHFSSS